MSLFPTLALVLGKGNFTNLSRYSDKQKFVDGVVAKQFIGLADGQARDAQKR